MNYSYISEKDTGGVPIDILYHMFKYFKKDKDLSLKNLLNNNYPVLWHWRSIKDGSNLLHLAIEYDSIKCVTFLLRYYSQRNPELLKQKNMDGVSPFLLASQFGKSSIFQELLSTRKIMLNDSDHRFKNIFHYLCATEGDIKSLRLLKNAIVNNLISGADLPDINTSVGFCYDGTCTRAMTALHVAAFSNNVSAFCLLLEDFGASISYILTDFNSFSTIVKKLIISFMEEEKGNVRGNVDLAKIYVTQLDLKCTICMENIKEGKKLNFVTECNHYYHPTCIKKWITNCLIEKLRESPSYNKNIQVVVSCPNCKGLIEPGDYSILFERLCAWEREVCVVHIISIDFSK